MPDVPGGASSDTAPYAVEREVEDIAALLGESGGSAFVWGTSSGAVAMEAAHRLPGIKKLALYVAPFIVDDIRPTVGTRSAGQSRQIVEAMQASSSWGLSEFLVSLGH